MNTQFVVFMVICGLIAFFYEKVWHLFDLETKISKCVERLVGRTHAVPSNSFGVRTKKGLWQSIVLYVIEFVLFGIIITYYIKNYLVFSDTVRVLFGIFIVILFFVSTKLHGSRFQVPSPGIATARIIRFLILFGVFVGVFVLWRFL